MKKHFSWNYSGYFYHYPDPTFIRAYWIIETDGEHFQEPYWTLKDRTTDVEVIVDRDTSLLALCQRNNLTL